MSFFPLRIHRNRCRLGLRLTPHWGAYSAHPQAVGLPSWFQGGRFAVGREWRG